MSFQRFVVIDGEPSSLSVFVTRYRGATARPSPSPTRAVYPAPRPTPRPASLALIIRLLQCVLDWLCSTYRVLLCVLMAVLLAFTVYVMQRVLLDSLWWSLWVVVEQSLLFVTGLRWLSQHMHPWHIDSRDGVLQTGRTRFELSHVCFFHAAERFANYENSCQPKLKYYGLELVSLHRPLFLPFFQQPSPINDAATHLNNALNDWKLQSRTEVPLPCQIIQRCRASSGSVPIKRQSVLLRDRPPHSSLHVDEREDASFWCYRRLPYCRFVPAMLQFFALATLIWLISIAVIILTRSTLLDNRVRRMFVIVSIVFVVSFLVLLVLYLRREAWHLTREGMVLYYIGWPLFSIRRSYELSHATTVTLDLAEAKTPGSERSHGTNMIGGRRFGLTWRDHSGQQLLEIENLLGSEAAYFAEKVRLLYPHIFGEEANEGLHLI